MTAPTDDRTRFPEPRRSALRTLLVEQTTDRDEGTFEPVLLGSFSSPDGGDDVAARPHRRRRLRQLAVAALASAAAAAVVVAAVLLPAGRHDATPAPVGSPPGPSTSATSSPARSGLYIPSVPAIASGEAVENGWTASSCPYLDDVDLTSLLGVDTGAVWSGTSTPVRCRVFAPSGQPLLDITTLAYDGPGEAEDAAAELRAGGTEVQAHQSIPVSQQDDPGAGPAVVTAFRTDGLTGTDAGWAATIAQGSAAFLVRTAPGLDRAAVERVTTRVVDVATGPGGSALTTTLVLCSHKLGRPFGAAFIGGQVTCSFGGDHPRDVSVQSEACPDGTGYDVFWSTADDATDHATYYGSQGTVLMSSPQPPSAVLQFAGQQACR